MKKIYAFLIALMLCFTARAEVDFTYEVGAEIVSSYVWRGQYNGGLSFQPEVLVGFDALDESIQLRAGVWGSIGASDWKFSQDTYFVSETDFMINVTAYGATTGYTHYYYCDEEPGVGEIQVGYNFDYLFGVGAYINWYTNVFNDTDYASYLEIGYDYTFEDIGLTLGGQLGMSPWKSDFYMNDRFAVVNIALMIDKEWEFDNVTLNLFGTGSLNPNGLVNGMPVICSASGDEKLYNQALNGTVGLGIWF
jgi:hypothetical protein